MKDKYEENKNDSQNLKEPFSLYGTFSIFDAIQKARTGVNMNTINKLAAQLSFSLQEMGNILHLSLRTLQRYSSSKVLDTDASAKALKLDALRVRGVEVFGTNEAFNEWLRQNNPAFNNQRPMDMLDTPYGFDLLEQVLGRIEHGFFA